MPVPRRQRRDRKSDKKERDWKQILWIIVSAIIAIAMASAYLLSYIAGQ